MGYIKTNMNVKFQLHNNMICQIRTTFSLQLMFILERLLFHPMVVGGGGLLSIQKSYFNSSFFVKVLIQPFSYVLRQWETWNLQKKQTLELQKERKK